MGKYSVNKEGYYGRFGGAFIPEILQSNVEALKKAYAAIQSDTSFREEYEGLLKDYVGRPSPESYGGA